MNSKSFDSKTVTVGIHGKSTVEMHGKLKMALTF
jgi:hypothetical protein